VAQQSELQSEFQRRLDILESEWRRRLQNEVVEVEEDAAKRLKQVILV
jgi:hypothetical protein